MFESKDLRQMIMMHPTKHVYLQSNRIQQWPPKGAVWTLVNSTTKLPLTAKEGSFAPHLLGKGPLHTRTFISPSGASLVIPTMPSPNIRDFAEHATNTQWKALLAAVGKEVKRRLKSSDFVYVSTHGHGVPWLHVRVETNPLYYKPA